MKRPPWVVLAPGERDSVEARVRAYFDRFTPAETMYSFHPGRGQYHAIYGVDEAGVGSENSLAEELSVDSREPVYAIDLSSEEPSVLAFRQRRLGVEDREPDELARSLGVPFPEPPQTSGQFPATRTVALVEGGDAEKARPALEQEHGRPLPAGFHFEQTPRGVVVWSDTGDIGFAATSLSERFPHATVYSIVASEDPGEFTVFIIRRGKGVGHYDIPPRDDPFSPAVDNIGGETSREGILAALGIPRKLLEATRTAGSDRPAVTNQAPPNGGL